MNKMAEDITRESVGSLTHELQIPASILLEEIYGELRNNQGRRDNLVHVVRSCLSRAGVSSVEHEALQIHTAIFTDVFMQNRSVRKKEHSLCEADYFQLLCCEELGWTPFVAEVLPCLRLETANRFLEKLLQFVRSQETRSCSLGEVRLLLAALTLIQSIALDFLVLECADGASGSGNQERSLSRNQNSTTNLESLANHFRICSENLLELSIQFHAPTLHDSNLFKQFVEILIVTIILMNPFSTAEETKNLLQNFHGGKIFLPSIYSRKVENVKDCRDSERSVKKGRWKRDVGFSWAEVSLVGEKKPGERLENDVIEESADESSLNCTFDMFSNLLSNICLNTTSTFSNLCKFFLENVTNVKNFRQQLTGLVLKIHDVRVGNHVLSSQKLYAWFLEFLQSLVDGTLVCDENMKSVSELYDNLKAFSLPFKYDALSWIRKDEINDILKLERQLVGQMDLELLKVAVKSNSCGWRDLLEHGLSNTDIKGWWKVGFLELVRNHTTVLCTEMNVKKLVNILHQVTTECKDPDDKKFVDDVYELFGAMFRHLPSILQEQVILHSLSLPGHKGRAPELNTCNLGSLLKKGDITEQLTVLLNRLTVASVDKLMVNILLLCLFDIDAVLQQTVHVALQNKAQILPVVEVLRRMASICYIHEACSSQPKLLSCLQKILLGTVINEAVANNIVQMFLLLTEPYSLEVHLDSSRTKLTRAMKCLLPQSDVFQQFIRPSLEAEMSEWISNSATSTDVCHVDQEIQEKNISSQTHEAYQIDQELQGQQATCEELAGDHADGEQTSRVDPETPSTLVNHSAEGDSAVCCLPVAVALNLLSELLARESTLDLPALNPFPLLTALANLYSRNFSIFEDGELNSHRLLVKQISQKIISLLSTAIWKHHRIFAPADFVWLKQQALQQGLLCVAVLKPALNVGCDVQLHDVLSSITRKLKYNDYRTNSVAGLVMLIQLGLLNDEMLDEVTLVVKQSHLTAGHDQLLVAVNHVLTMSLTTEMYRFVNIVILLLSNQDQPLPMDSKWLVQELDKEAHLRAQTSQLLTDVLLLTSATQMSEASHCHIISNYHIAIQSILPGETTDPNLLLVVLCHLCVVISTTSDRAAQILQVSALDVLTKLKNCWSRRLGGVLVEQKLDHEKAVDCVENYIYCVQERSVRSALLAKLADMGSA